MTSDELAAMRRRLRREGTDSGRSLTTFLKEEQLSLLDVVAGASPGTRRLYVGDRESARARYAVSLPRGQGFDGVPRNESAILAHLAERLPDELVSTVPEESEVLSGPASESALVVTAVPGLGRPPSSDTRKGLPATVRWLVLLWEATAGDRIHTRLGREPIDVLLGRARDAASLGGLMLPLLHARERMASVEVPSTVSHGCLCRRHVHHDGAEVTGVDDWGLAATGSDPVRDLGRYAVDLVGERLPEVMTARTECATAVRRAVTHGLGALGVPPRAWRDVLLLAQLEVAMERSSRRDESGVALLRRTLQALAMRDGETRYPT
jgi:hypothetical protein